MPYREQVSLLLRVLPIVGREQVFALKGGTAINLFVRDLPRLSVDIDLTFLPLVERNEALVRIRDALQHIAAAVENQIPEATVNASPRHDAPKLVVGARGRDQSRTECDFARQRLSTERAPNEAHGRG